MTSALSPRDIQTRIRSGASLDDVAREAEMPVEKVEPFAAPVLAEREHVAGTALQCPVRRRGETGSVRAMRGVVGDKLAAHGVLVDDADWDAWRNDDRRWSVVGRYELDDEQREATFIFDPRARFSIATNDEARWLIGEITASRSRKERAIESEPTIDLSDELALVRAVQGRVPLVEGDFDKLASPPAVVRPSGVDAASTRRDGEAHPAATQPGMTQAGAAQVPTAETEVQAPSPAPSSQEQADVEREAAPAEPATGSVQERSEADSQPIQPVVLLGDDEDPADYTPAELEQVDGVYDFVPQNTSDMDVLYEMLSSFAEDSVNIYAGLTNPVTQEPPVPAPDSVDEPEDEPQPTVPGPLTAEPTEPQPLAPEPTEPQAERTAPEPIEMPAASSPAAIAADEQARPELAEVEADDAESPAVESATTEPTQMPAATRAIAIEPVEPGAATEVTEQEPDLSDVVDAPETPVVTATEEVVAEVEMPTVKVIDVEVPVAKAKADSTAKTPAPEAQAKAKPKPRPRKKRASVPSWDEIMFGGPTTKKN